jgi:hypothetical protein
MIPRRPLLALPLAGLATPAPGQSDPRPADADDGEVELVGGPVGRSRPESVAGEKSG